MTTTDWITLATCLVILWYTFETFRLRRLTQRQFNIFSSTYDRQVARERVAADPVFIFETREVVPGAIVCQFENVGASITDIAFTADETNLRVTSTPKSAFPQGATIKFYIHMKGADFLSPHMIFTMSYRNLYGEHLSKRYRLVSDMSTSILEELG